MRDVCETSGMQAGAGAIYVATGPDYLALACQSARSLRHHNPGLAIDLFTDLAPLSDPGLFDRVHPVPEVHPRAKIDCMGLSRFDRTLYLDCDTLAVGPLGDLFRVLERFELAIAHDMRRNTPLVRQGHAHATPYAFPQMNSGVMLYRRSAPMQAFLTEWARLYRQIGVPRDQVALKDLLWSSDLRFYVLPPEFNLRRVTLLDAWEPGDARPTLIHTHRLMDHLHRSDRAPLTTLDQIRAAERQALRREWEAAGSPPFAAPLA